MKAHIFKRRSVGEREEVTIKFFDEDNLPIKVGGGGVLDSWKGAYDADLDYKAGDLVRHENATYLAVRDAPASGLGPGESSDLTPINVQQSSNQRPGTLMPRDVEGVVANMTGSTGYNMGGSSRWIRVHGDPGEQLTLLGTGGNNLRFHVYNPDGSDYFSDHFNYPSGTVVTLPAEGYLGIEIDVTSTTVKYTSTANGPQPVPVPPWELFA